MSQIKKTIDTALVRIQSYINPENKAFFHAIETGKYDEVKEILKTARVNSFNKVGQTPLGYACSKLDVEMVNLLLEHGANPNIYADTPPLIQAVQTAINCHNVYGLAKDMQSMLAVHEDNAFLIVNNLIEAQADTSYTDKKGISLLMSSAYFGNTKVFQLLINLKADTEAKDKDSKNLFHYALMGESKEIIQALCEMANVSQLSEYKKQIPNDYRKAAELNDLIDTLLIYHTLDKNLVASKVTKPRKI